MSFGIAQSYSQVKQYSGIEDASPHKLVDLMYAAAQDRIAEAKGQIDRQDIAGKGISIGKAISIVEELRRTLDREKGGELAENLHDLYVYSKERLLHANLQNDKEALTEVASLLQRVHDGWNSMPEEFKKQTAEA